MLIKKRQALIATLVVALCAAVAVNWYFTKPTSESTETTSVDESVTGNLGDTLFVAGTTAKSEQETDSADTTTTESDEGTKNSAEYFSQAKLKRSQTYDEVIDNIEEVADDENLPDSEKSKISVLLSDYQRDMKVQTDAENLITAKTGSECLVVINDESCQVILEKNTLNETLILQITEIIEKNTDIFSENLTIIELK